MNENETIAYTEVVNAENEGDGYKDDGNETGMEDQEKQVDGSVVQVLNDTDIIEKIFLDNYEYISEQDKFWV